MLVIERNSEEWEAVAPDLHANDAQADGRAIRWMIVAGGPGVGLVDMGEGEEANLATAKAMGEQRSRFMRARQQYFAWALATIALTAYNRAVRLGKVAGEVRTLGDIRIAVPDISPADNAELGRRPRSWRRRSRPVRDQGLGGRDVAAAGGADGAEVCGGERSTRRSCGGSWPSRRLDLAAAAHAGGRIAGE